MTASPTSLPYETLMREGTDAIFDHGAGAYQFAGSPFRLGRWIFVAISGSIKITSDSSGPKVDVKQSRIRTANGPKNRRETSFGGDVGQLSEDVTLRAKAKLKDDTLPSLDGNLGRLSNAWQGGPRAFALELLSHFEIGIGIKWGEWMIESFEVAYQTKFWNAEDHGLKGVNRLFFPFSIKVNFEPIERTVAGRAMKMKLQVSFDVSPTKELCGQVTRAARTLVGAGRTAGAALVGGAAAGGAVGVGCLILPLVWAGFAGYMISSGREAGDHDLYIAWYVSEYLYAVRKPEAPARKFDPNDPLNNDVASRELKTRAVTAARADALALARAMWGSRPETESLSIYKDWLIYHFGERYTETLSSHLKQAAENRWKMAPR
jgi:hypothetical protein